MQADFSFNFSLNFLEALNNYFLRFSLMNLTFSVLLVKSAQKVVAIIFSVTAKKIRSSSSQNLSNAHEYIPRGEYFSLLCLSHAIIRDKSVCLWKIRRECGVLVSTLPPNQKDVLFLCQNNIYNRSGHCDRVQQRENT